MAQVTVSKTIDAPVARVFSTWVDEYPDIYKFHPGLAFSEVKTPEQTQVGADRICYMKDEKNWVKEKIASVERDKSLVLDVHESSMPLKSAKIYYRFERIEDHRTRLTITIDFRPSMGLAGTLMAPLMKTQFRKLVTALLEANSAYVETGKQFNPTRAAA